MISCGISLSRDRSATVFFIQFVVLKLLELLEPFEPFDLGRHQPAILLAPFVIGRLADSRLTADLGKGNAFVALLQNESNLLLAETRLLHGKQSARPRWSKLEFANYPWSKKLGADHTSKAGQKAR